MQTGQFVLQYVHCIQFTRNSRQSLAFLPWQLHRCQYFCPVTVPYLWQAINYFLKF